MTSETADFMLVRILGVEQTNCLSLNETKPYYCGRDKNNDLSCDSANVSARHCIFLCYPNEVYIKDLNSNNGVFVNGKKIEQLFKLRENDLIGIGTHRQSTDDSKKFIYRLKKQTQAITERQDSEARKRMLESKPDHQSSKFCKYSDINQKDEKPSISHQSPAILNITISDDDTDTNSTIILMKNDIKDGILNTSDLRINDEIILDSDSDTEKFSDNNNRMDDFHNVKDSSENDTDQIYEDNAKSPPVVLDLEDETDIEEELPLDEPEKNAEPIPVSTRPLNNSPFVIDVASDLSEATTIFNDNDFNGNRNLIMNSGPLLDVKLEDLADIEELLLDEPDIMIIEDIPPHSEKPVTTKTDLTGLQNNHTVMEKPLDLRNHFLVVDKALNRGFSINTDKNLRTSEKRKILDRPTVTNSSESETRNSSSTPVLDEKTFTSETISDKLLSQILEWNPINFQISSTGNKCPILKCYESHEQYYEVLKSHLISDIAYKVKRGLENINSKHSTFKKCDVVKSSASKIKIAGADQLSLLNFYLYLTVSKSFKIPTAGDLVRLKISRKDIKSSLVIIGYIKSSTSINSERDCSQITCAVTTKFLDLNIYTSTVLSLHVITSLLPALNMVQAMTDFESSPLLPLILNPGIEKNFPPRDPLEKVILSPSSCIKPQMYIVSSNQVHAVMEVSKIIRNEEPKICIIEGPPGTGKTTVLIDTISNVMCTKEENISKPKILVCAKSRTEVDEIVSRLAFVKQKLDQGSDIKLVRIGDPYIGDPEVKKFTSQVLAKRHIELGKREFLLAEESGDGHEYQKKLSLLHSDFDKLEIPSNSIKTHVIETCFEILESGRNVREMPEEENSKLMDFVENMILLDANVIVCTLSMRLANKLDAVYGNKEHSFQACIIDEASQIQEIEILKPLTYGVKTLVLLGDSFRRLLFEKSYSKSSNPKITDKTLFSRIKANYKELQNSPTFSLDLQYRINPNVVYWLNKIIYEEKMKSGVSTMQYPLLPYKVLNFFPYTIRFDEPSFVSTLISCIVKYAKIDQIIKPMTIGVILPNSALKPNVISAINTSLSMMSTDKCDLFKIDVDTLSAFKNQERDVIIISCTKKLGNMEEPVDDEWLYAAMTRVKHSLILYGTFRKNMKPSFLKSIVRTGVGKRCYFNIHDSTSASELKNYIIRKRFR